MEVKQLKADKSLGSAEIDVSVLGDKVKKRLLFDAGTYVRVPPTRGNGIYEDAFGSGRIRRQAVAPERHGPGALRDQEESHLAGGWCDARTQAPGLRLRPAA